MTAAGFRHLEARRQASDGSGGKTASVTAPDHSKAAKRLQLPFAAQVEF
jgi:hypothetical protein